MILFEHIYATNIIYYYGNTSLIELYFLFRTKIVLKKFWNKKRKLIAELPFL
jgi:hypothetical protein